MNDSQSDGPDPVIELSDVRFSWDKKRDLLNIEELRFDRGERVFIAGPSGSGKTTLLSLIAGIMPSDEGTVRVSGRQMNRLGGAARDRFRADHIGFVFQMFNLVPYLTVVENVTLPCRFSARRQERAEKRSDSVETEAFRLLRSLGLDDHTAAGHTATELSVGQQQRVAAARALIGSPDIIIADEPTSALDRDHRRTFLNLLFDECEARKSTLVFVSHDTGLETLFDRTIHLRDINRA